MVAASFSLGVVLQYSPLLSLRFLGEYGCHWWKFKGFLRGCGRFSVDAIVAVALMVYVFRVYTSYRKN
jgi:hypothetical protein